MLIITSARDNDHSINYPPSDRIALTEKQPITRVIFAEHNHFIRIICWEIVLGHIMKASLFRACILFAHVLCICKNLRRYLVSTGYLNHHYIRQGNLYLLDAQTTRYAPKSYSAPEYLRIYLVLQIPIGRREESSWKRTVPWSSSPVRRQSQKRETIPTICPGVSAAWLW